MQYREPALSLTDAIVCLHLLGADVGSASLWQPLLPTSASTQPPSATYSQTTLPHAPVDDDAVIYSGSLLGCVAVNLRPHRAYGFRIYFATSASDSEPSDYM